MTTNSKLWGLLAQYENPATVFHGCEAVRDAGYSKWDACTPFPVHGLDKAMGLKPSVLPWAVLIIGISGSAFALWFERFVITVTSLHRDALVSSWDYFVPVTEVFFLLGTFGLFFTMFLLFIRFFPVIAMSEVKGVMPQANPHWEGYAHVNGAHAAPAHAAPAAAGGH